MTSMEIYVTENVDKRLKDIAGHVSIGPNAVEDIAASIVSAVALSTYFDWCDVHTTTDVFEKAYMGRRPLDVVNHPPHYTYGEKEIIEHIEDMTTGIEYHIGTVLKYIGRRGKKDGGELVDLQKARWFLDRAISLLTNGS
jgi:hypothetical protein